MVLASQDRFCALLHTYLFGGGNLTVLAILHAQKREGWRDK